MHEQQNRNRAMRLKETPLEHSVSYGLMLTLQPSRLIPLRAGVSCFNGQTRETSCSSYIWGRADCPLSPASSSASPEPDFYRDMDPSPVQRCVSAERGPRQRKKQVKSRGNENSSRASLSIKLGTTQRKVLMSVKWLLWYRAFVRKHSRIFRPCLLSCRPALHTPPNPWITDLICEQHTLPRGSGTSTEPHLLWLSVRTHLSFLAQC